MGKFCGTQSGKLVPFLEPKESDICIEDIAHSLSLQCRFNGATSKFYSVAQHSCHVAQMLPTDLKLCGLLHDAAEAYIGDIISPFKEKFPKIQEAEDALLTIIFEKFGCTMPLPEDVLRADRRVCATEIRDLCAFPSSLVKEAYDFTINPWSTKKAEREFLLWFSALWGAECHFSI